MRSANNDSKHAGGVARGGRSPSLLAQPFPASPRKHGLLQLGPTDQHGLERTFANGRHQDTRVPGAVAKQSLKVVWGAHLHQGPNGAFKCVGGHMRFLSQQLALKCKQRVQLRFHAVRRVHQGLHQLACFVRLVRHLLVALLHPTQESIGMGEIFAVSRRRTQTLARLQHFDVGRCGDHGCATVAAATAAAIPTTSTSAYCRRSSWTFVFAIAGFTSRSGSPTGRMASVKRGRLPRHVLCLLVDNVVFLQAHVPKIDLVHDHGLSVRVAVVVATDEHIVVHGVVLRLEQGRDFETCVDQQTQLPVQ